MNFAQLVGTQDIREPLWGIHVRLTEAEYQVLHTTTLRRLHFIHHSGCSILNTQHNATRLQHTLGVFALVAHFCPDWAELRMAALLHDIGHAPFSHTLESIEGIDHHLQTELLLDSPELNPLLTRNGFQKANLLDLMKGNIANPLRTKTNLLNLDHLDSWVRSGRNTGKLTMPASQLLAGMTLEGDTVVMDAAAAELLLQLIIDEARFHSSPINIGPNTIMRQLVVTLIDHQITTPAAISGKTDAWLEAILMQCEFTAEETHRLFYRPQEICVTRERELAPPNAFIMTHRKLYLAVPKLQADAGALADLPSYPLLQELPSLLGTYYVSWEPDPTR